MSQRKPSTFWALVIVLVFVAFLVLVTVAFGGRSITHCNGQVTLVNSGEGCPSQGPTR